jgi:hypothetical protein
MRISQAVYQIFEGGKSLTVIIDGHEFWSDTKYTILEMGYATYLSNKSSLKVEKWIRKNGETIPPDPSEGRAALESGSGMLITSDPILFTLSYESWWGERNGKLLPQNVPLPIPLFSEAVSVMKNRKILNDFNNKYRGFIPNFSKGLNF